MSVETSRFGAFELPPEALGSPAPTLPVLGRIGVVEVAVVAKADWLELVMLRAKRNLDHAREVAKAASCVVPSGMSTIEKDAEVASFLRERFRGQMTIEALHAACVEAFGLERAPSRSRIQTFRSRCRGRR